MGNLHRFGAVLNQWFENRGLSQRLAGHQAVLLWPDIVGKPAARHSRAIGYRNDALLIEVDHPIWAQELSLRRQDLLRRLNMALSPGGQKITNLIFHTAVFEKRSDNKDGVGGFFPSHGHEKAVAVTLPPWLDEAEVSSPIGRVVQQWGRKALARHEPVPCVLCTAPVEKKFHAGDGAASYAMCPVCRQGLRPGGTLWAIGMNLAREPWLDGVQMSRRIPGLKLENYESAKELLLHKWKSKLEKSLADDALTQNSGNTSQTVALRDLALRYVMLQAACRPENLTEELVQGALGPFADVLFGGNSTGGL